MKVRLLNDEKEVSYYLIKTYEYNLTYFLFYSI